MVWLGEKLVRRFWFVWGKLCKEDCPWGTQVMEILFGRGIGLVEERRGRAEDDDLFGPSSTGRQEGQDAEWEEKGRVGTSDGTHVERESLVWLVEYLLGEKSGGRSLFWSSLRDE
jgi:hypothetical protein